MSSDPKLGVKRDCYIGWDDYFMSVAVLSAFRSKDPNRQVWPPDAWLGLGLGLGLSAFRSKDPNRQVPPPDASAHPLSPPRTAAST